MQKEIFKKYLAGLVTQIEAVVFDDVKKLVDKLFECFEGNKQVFIIGNGGSGGNGGHA